MTAVPPNQPPSDPSAGRRMPGSPSSRSLDDGPGEAGLHKPRVKMLETSGDLAPVGATYTPPTAAPLPERGSGLQLFISALAAAVAVVFLLLLAYKL